MQQRLPWPIPLAGPLTMAQYDILTNMVQTVGNKIDADRLETAALRTRIAILEKETSTIAPILTDLREQHDRIQQQLVALESQAGVARHVLNMVWAVLTATALVLGNHFFDIAKWWEGK